MKRWNLMGRRRSIKLKSLSLFCNANGLDISVICNQLIDLVRVRSETPSSPLIMR